MRVPVHRAVAGASLLSASATLPLHLLPVLVLALGKSGEFPVSHAGWVGSMYMLGQLASVVLLPACGVKAVRWSAAAACALLVLLAAGAATLRHPGVVLASWLCVGALAGVLQYLGTTTAAAAPNPKNAFAWRMATSSVFAAALMAWLQLSRALLTDYVAVSLQFMGLFAVTAAVGLLLYRSTPLQGAAPPPAAAGDASPCVPSRLLACGLAVLFVLFIGQQGLWSVVVQGASARGFDVRAILWAVAASKLAAAALMVAGMSQVARGQRATPSLRLWGVLVGVGGLAMGWSGSVAAYIAGLALWEIALNVLSARFQAALAGVDRRQAGMWITAAIFLGAASGHALAPFAAAHGALAMFAVFAATSAVAPWMWSAFAGRNESIGFAFGRREA